MKAAELMTRDLVTIAPDALLADAIRLMLGHRVSGLPVVDGAGRLVGLLTEGDLLHRAETGTDAAPARMGWLRGLFSGARMAEDYTHTHGQRVRDVMTREVTTVGEDTSLDEVVRIMDTRHVRRVPVVAGERLVGMVSRSDLVRALGQALDRAGAPGGAAAGDDESLRRSILAEMARQRWAPGQTVNVHVRDGVVALHGMIFDERVRDALRVMAEAVPGVKGVQDELMRVDPKALGLYGA